MKLTFSMHVFRVVLTLPLTHHSVAKLSNIISASVVILDMWTKSVFSQLSSKNVPSIVNGTARPDKISHFFTDVAAGWGCW